MSARDIQRGRPGKKKAAKSRYDRAPRDGETEQRVRPPTPQPEFAASHSDARIIAGIERATEDVTRHLATRPPSFVLSALRDAQTGQPAGTDYDKRTGGRSAWCWEHERDVTECHKMCGHGHDQRIDLCRDARGWPCYRTLTCTGEPTDNRSDPTGDSVAMGDRARYLEKRYVLAAAMFAKAGRIMCEIAANVHHIDGDGVAERMPDEPVPTCCEPNCEDPADSKCAGRCNPDYQWKRRWEREHPGEVAPHVPEHVIDARLAARENRGVHVDPTKHGRVA